MPQGKNMKKFIFASMVLCSTSLLYSKSIEALDKLVDFETSINRHDTTKTVATNPLFLLGKKLYEKHALALLMPEENPIIPKIIHQIWLGSPVPEHLKEFMASWKKMHPDWHYILWTDTDAEKFPLKNRHVYNAAKNYGQRSDILRYEILYQYGGLYIDVDFRCVKPFDILHHALDFYCGLITESYLANGLIASTPGHTLLKKVIDSIHSVSVKDNFQNIIDLTGPGLLQKIFLEYAETCPGRNVLMPCTYFYPSPNTARHLPKRGQDAYIKPESFAIHYWACTWQKPSAYVK